MKLLFITLYLSAQLLIAFYISKRIKTEKDFFLAGRNLPLWLLSFSLFATWFGAETVIGTSGAVYSHGLAGSRADPFGYTLCLVLLGFFLATKLWLGGYTTLADFFRQRFGARVEKIAILIIVPSTLLWGSAQLRAFAQVVTSMTDWDLSFTLWIAFAFVTLYTLLGGLLGDIVTDLIQGILITLGLLTLLFFVFPRDLNLIDWFRSLPQERLSFVMSGESFFSRLDRWTIPILGSLVAQELISRVLAAKNPKTARNSAFASATIYLFVGSIPVVLGLLGPTLITGFEHQEDFIIKLAEKYLPPFAFIIFSGSLISAILATIDSILLSSSALLSHNIIVPLFKIRDERYKLLSARLVIVLSALTCIMIAFSSNSIYQLVQMASSLGTAGVLVITLMGLHFKKGGERAATIALISGLFALPIYDHIFKFQAPFILTVLTSLLLYLIIGLWPPERLNLKVHSKTI